MAFGKKANHAFLFLACAVLLAILASPLNAAECGTSIPSSGTCSGAVHSISCTSLPNQGCCEQFSKCEWATTYEVDDYSCQTLGGNPSVHCSAYTNNEVACRLVGCDWVHTAPGSCGTNDGLRGYGEDCSTTTECAKCLVCENNMCTQRPGMCSTIPREYVAPPPSTTASTQTGNPDDAITGLETGTGGAVVGSSSAFYKAGWFSDWKAMGLIGVAIVCSIIALAAMMGKAFNLPEIKAFANNEIKQAVISALIIVSLVALVSFFDEVARLSLDGADLPVTCVSTEPCYVTAAKYYLTTLQDTGKEYAKDELRQSIVIAKRASYGYNLNLNKIYFMFAGISIRFNAGDTLVAERHGALFTQVGKLLASLYAQNYFVDVVAFGVAPMFILLGVVLRTFFFTRKLGGLLLALAISLFLIYPLTFAFAWYTLNVTVYGERTLAVADPLCPAECTGTYPVAFFSDPSTGELVQFSTTQAIMRAGITKNNWDLGGPDLDGVNGRDFPGLVACRDLSSMNIPDIMAPNSCSECPDYCRDVPFPAGMPGCDIEKCSECNPGCKIVRQRLTCQTDPACKDKCPISCRTQVPLENKCFSDELGGVIEADMEVICKGCSKYPHWCRFLKIGVDQNGDDVFTPIYDDEVCNGIENDPFCPVKCSYITRLDTDATCDTLCSYTNPNTQDVTICPAQCRVLQLYDEDAYPEWVSTYDKDPPNFAEFCSFTSEIEAACQTCNTYPECMIGAWDADGLPAECAPYPVNNDLPQLCLQCPDYCRRDDFTGVFATNEAGIGYSKVERDGDDLPAVCDPTKVDIACSTTGDPIPCEASCRMDGIPLLCRTLDETDPDGPSLCRYCPENARFTLKYQKIGEEGCEDCDPVCNVWTAPAEGGAVFQSTKGKAMAAAPGKYAGTIWFDFPPTAPVMVSASISPDPAYADNDLSGYCMATDVNDDNLFYEYQWELNGNVYGAGTTTSGFPAGQEVLVDTVPSANLEAGQQWVLQCQAYDEGGLYSASSLLSSTVSILALPGEPPCTVTWTDPALQEQYDCSEDVCNGECRGPAVELPNEADYEECGDAATTGCPYGCRVTGLDSYLDPICAGACADLLALQPGCFVTVGQTWPVCGEYIGNGGPSCQGSTCSLFTSLPTCNGAVGAGCNWNSGKQYCQKLDCLGKTEGECFSASGCAWMRTESLIPIANRDGIYDNRDNCLQCPEQCRLEDYTGSCGLENNPGGNTYIDCSMTSCTAACRIAPRPLEPDFPLCHAYPETTGQSCKDCPALCRRQSGLLFSMDCPPEACQLTSDPLGVGCIDQCRMDNPPEKACEGCFDCDYDCSFYPAIRTDCSDICSDEALAGPVNIAPSDFAKSLPGAKTSEAGMGARNVGVLYIPAVVLPLFCIVMVVAAIRVLSPILGGDIEIPGLGRII